MILVRYDTKWSKVLVDCIFCLNCPTTMQQMLSIKYSIALRHKIKLKNSIVVITVIWFSVLSIHNHQYHNPLTTWLTSSTHTSSHINSYCQTKFCLSTWIGIDVCQVIDKVISSYRVCCLVITVLSHLCICNNYTSNWNCQLYISGVRIYFTSHLFSRYDGYTVSVSIDSASIVVFIF